MSSQLAFLFSGRTKDSVMWVVTRQEWRFRDDFARWLSANWEIWLRFEREANRVYEAGRRHWSSRTIVEYLRHETALREKDSALKLNNNWAPSMARLYLTLHPERANLFELREKEAA